MQNLSTVLGMQNLGVELYAVQAARRILGRCHRAIGRMGHNLEAGSRRLNIIVMAHPADILCRQTVKQRARGIKIHQRLAILAFRSFGDLAAQHMHHELAAVADAKNRHTPSINFRVNGRRIGQIGAVGAAREDNTLGIFGFDFGEVRAVRIDLAVNVALTHAARNQLIVLAAEVKNNNGFLLHGVTPFSFSFLLSNNYSILFSA